MEQEKIPQKRGPKAKIIIDQKFLKKVEYLAKLGFNEKQTYQYLGMGHNSWYRYVKKFPEILERRELGDLKLYKLATKNIYKALKKGNLDISKFVMKNRFGYSENSTVEIKDMSYIDIPKNLSKTVKCPIEASKIYQKIMVRKK